MMATDHDEDDDNEVDDDTGGNEDDDGNSAMGDGATGYNNKGDGDG